MPSVHCPSPPPKKIYILMGLCNPFVPVTSQLQMHCLLDENEHVSRGRWRSVTGGKGFASGFCCMLWAGFHSTCKARLPQCLAASVARSFLQHSLRHFHSWVLQWDISGEEIPLALYTMDLWQVAPALHYSNLLCYPVSQSCTFPKKVHVSTCRRGGGSGPLLRCCISAFGVIHTWS